VNLIAPFLPAIRVWLFGQIVWALGKAGLPAEQAGPITDWLMGGIPLLLTLAYGAWASWRERKPV
jgi:hypothetical protein